MNPMNSKSLELLEYARQTIKELSKHPVLSRYWNELTIVLKGSTSRGNADDYSDIDLVIFCEEPVRQAIVDGYFDSGLTHRKDGIFIFIKNGHYHVESYDQLRGYFAQQDFVHAWDYQQAIRLHDPEAAYPGIILAGQKILFADTPGLLKRAYLDLQLDLDWMRMPILRADGPATLLHFTKLLGGICRMAYLLEGQPYPPDKWLFAFLETTAFGKDQHAAILHYYSTAPSALTLVRDQPFEDQPIYQEASVLIDRIAIDIQKKVGEQPWLARWYDFV